MSASAAVLPDPFKLIVGEMVTDIAPLFVGGGEIAFMVSVADGGEGTLDALGGINMSSTVPVEMPLVAGSTACIAPLFMEGVEMPLVAGSRAIPDSASDKPASGEASVAG